MPEWLNELISSGEFMPHAHCYLGNTRLVWLDVLSDSSITLANVTIPITLGGAGATFDFTVASCKPLGCA